MKKTIFQTERLQCRLLDSADGEALFAVYSDPEAMRWVGDAQPITPLQCVEWLKVTETNYEKRGYGMFALVDRATSEVVGFAGLVHPGGQAEVEVKYAFLKSHWGLGLASEAVPALLAFGAAEHGLDLVIATVAPENRASLRVLEKAGMTYRERREHPDGETLVYEWRKPHGENLEGERCPK